MLFDCLECFKKGCIITHVRERHWQHRYLERICLLVEKKDMFDKSLIVVFPYLRQGTGALQLVLCAFTQTLCSQWRMLPESSFMQRLFRDPHLPSVLPRVYCIQFWIFFF